MNAFSKHVWKCCLIVLMMNGFVYAPRATLPGNESNETNEDNQWRKQLISQHINDCADLMDSIAKLLRMRASGITALSIDMSDNSFFDTYAMALKIKKDILFDEMVATETTPYSVVLFKSDGVALNDEEIRKEYRRSARNENRDNISRISDKEEQGESAVQHEQATRGNRESIRKYPEEMIRLLLRAVSIEIIANRDDAKRYRGFLSKLDDDDRNRLAMLLMEEGGKLEEQDRIVMVDIIDVLNSRIAATASRLWIERLLGDVHMERNEIPRTAMNRFVGVLCSSGSRDQQAWLQERMNDISSFLKQDDDGEQALPAMDPLLP